MRITEVRRALEGNVSQELPSPLFNILLGWADDYDDLFAKKFTDITGVEVALSKVVRTGRVLLIGPGGGSKTIILQRIARKATNYAVLFSDLKRWSLPDYARWNELESFGEKVDFLLLNFGVGGMGIAELDSVRPDVPRLILIDGLNEVRSSVGAEILDALDDFVRYGTKVSVIASDRLVRRTLQNQTRWQLASVLPLAEAEVAHQVTRHFSRDIWGSLDEASKALLRSPYFLNTYLREGGVARSKADELRAYFERHALKLTEVDDVARAAFELYGEASRTFSLDRFKSYVGEDATSKLLAAGALIRDNDLAFFDHHLKHDYLAARYVAATERIWNRDTFNRITFHGSSFDTIVLAMQQIRELVVGDRFIRALYDWNIYGAGYGLSEGQHNVSAEMSVVVHAMFAERRWDIFYHSSKAAEDILHLINSDLSIAMLKAKDRNELLRLVGGLPSQVEWYQRWQQLYTSPIETDASNEEVRLLTEDDSVLGWTSSNVLRRKHLSDQQQQELCQLLGATDTPVVQWRAVHVLGRFPSDRNVAALIGSIRQGSREVRYGAVRSLVEMAALAEDGLSRTIFREIASVAQPISEFKNVVEEFQRALIVRKEAAPKQWVDLSRPAIAAVQQATSNFTSREDWDRTLRLMIDSFGYRREK